MVDNVHTFDTTLSVIANNVDRVDTDCAKIYPAEQHILGVINNDIYQQRKKRSRKIGLMNKHSKEILFNVSSG